eukprot:492842-Prorocentrum_lima.AAC.1
MSGCLRRLFATTAWCPWWLPTALGPAFGQKGSPRCPRTAATAAGHIAVATHRACGTEPTIRLLRRKLAQLLGRPVQEMPFAQPHLRTGIERARTALQLSLIHI